MNQEKWEQLIGRIKDESAVIEHGTSEGEFANETVETIVFENAAGRLKLERTIRPRLLGEKTKYAGRLGSQVSIEKVYSEDELVDSIKLFKQNGSDWQELDPNALI